MINALPVVGWLLLVIVNISLAVPFWFCWTICGLGAEYFDFMPSKYQSIPFWNCVGLFMVLSILKSVLIPKIVSVSNDSKCGEK